MWRLHYYRLALAAWVRGLFYRWPRQAPLPPNYTGCSCGLSAKDSRDMYHHGWEPWCFQWTRAYGIARLFRVPMSPEEMAVECDWEQRERFTPAVRRAGHGARPWRSHTTMAEPHGVWCLVANVTREPHTEGGDELRLGTKLFSPGAKVYVLPCKWGDGGERLTVIGRHRKSRRLITAVVAGKRLTNWRAKQVFDPQVIPKIDTGRPADEAKALAEKLAELWSHQPPH